MNLTILNTLFEKISHLRVGVIGDFAVDFYYQLQTQTGEQSVETGKEVFWAKIPKTSLGGAGNVVQNLAALGVKNLQVFGFVGNDLYGREMRFLLSQVGADISTLYTLDAHWDTCTYTKPMTATGEANRIDFGTHNQLPEKVFEIILENLEKALPMLDVLIINQQFANPLINATRLASLQKLFQKYPQCLFLADLRDLGGLLREATLKVNTEELGRILGSPPASDLGQCVTQARRLHAITKAPVLVTRGAEGILYVDKEDTAQVKGIALEGPLDTVGAGDTVVAAFAVAKAVGTSVSRALQMANLAAAVTIQKLNQTGTATPQEIMALSQQVGQIHHS
ncbi:MAG: bifunctional heptose 7-phosphate kinase/heptose 1-phosphate adenyltransferase [Runella sp.]